MPAGIAILAVLGWSTRYDPAAALIYDAGSFFRMASELADGSFGPLLGHQAGLFLDPGYPIALSLWFRVLGQSVWGGMLLNAVLWSCSVALYTAIVRHWLVAQHTVLAGSVFAVSPVLTSFAPKLYSEHLAITGLLLALWACFRWQAKQEPRSRALSLAALAAGIAILVLTKSAFFPLAVFVAIIFAVRRHWSAASVVALTVAVLLPFHLEVERDGRSRMAAAHQAAMVVRWPFPVAVRCGVYSLSWSLGLALFPEVEGACEAFSLHPDKPMAALNPKALAQQWVPEGFSLGDAVRIAATHPAKYALVCGINLLGACWLEGFYPQPLTGLPGTVRALLWIFKVLISSTLWYLAITGALRAWRRSESRFFASLLVVPLLYTLAVHANVLGEQRYFFPAIPILYALASLGLNAWNAGRSVRQARTGPDPTAPSDQGALQTRA